MSIRKDNARALMIMKNLRSRMGDDENKSLRNAMDRLISAMDSPLFSSLLDIEEYYQMLLGLEPQQERQQSKSAASSYKTSNLSANQGSRVTVTTNSPERLSSPTQQSSEEITPVKPEWEYLEVVLKKDPSSTGGFGFHIAGGVDCPITEADPGIFVTRITPNSCADLDGRLRVDDQLLAVNGISLEHVTNMEAVQTLRRGANSLHLVVRRYVGSTPVPSQNTVDGQQSQHTKSPELASDLEDAAVTPIWFDVELHKPTASTGLGLSIAGGQDMEDDQIPIPGIFITRINPGGLADRDGRIQPGDQLMQVNGIDVSSLTHAEAVRILRNAGQDVHLVFTRVPESDYGAESDEPQQRASNGR